MKKFIYTAVIASATLFLGACSNNNTETTPAEGEIIEVDELTIAPVTDSIDSLASTVQDAANTVQNAVQSVAE